MLFVGEVEPKWITLIKANLRPEHFRILPCKHLFERYLELDQDKKPKDLLALAAGLDEAEGQVLLSEILEKKINVQKAESGIKETIQKILLREWMEQREAIKMKIHSGKYSDEEAVELAKQFDAIKRNPPEVV
jgi:DNA primase